MSIRTRPTTDDYRKNFDQSFGRPERAARLPPEPRELEVLDGPARSEPRDLVPPGTASGEQPRDE